MTTELRSQRSGLGLRLLVGATIFALVGGPSLAASKATLGGKIVNSAGKPVSGATVQILKPGSEKVLFSATTAGAGVYGFEGLDIGTYHIRVEPKDKSLRGDTVSAEVTGKGLVVNWHLSANDKPVALAIPGKVGSEEDEICSPVQIGEYEVNRCVLAGGAVLAIGLGVGLGVGLSGGGGGGPAESPSK
jgi:Carboxypeptidase regulatory-like domain